MSVTPPVLVIAHEATRTGSPRVLADLLGYVAPRLATPIAIELLAGGPLSAELRSHARIPFSTAVTPAAVVVNSALAAGAALRFARSVPALIYVHEEGDALRVLPPDCIEALNTRFDRLLSVSDSAATDLAELGVPGERIAVLPPVVDVGPEVPPADRTSNHVPLVIGCGEAGWRKGADLFTDVAHRTIRQRSAHFEWAGRRSRPFARILDHDAAALGLDQKLRWLGELDDLSDLYRRADLLLMTSREDPQPLVPLEAAGHGVATVGFEVGGLRYLGRRNMVATVPYPDTAALAALIVDLLDDSQRRRSLATTASRIARSEHSIDVLGPRFLLEISDLLTGGCR